MACYYLEEYNKCKDDFSYFAKNHFKVYHPTKGVISFSPFDFQKRFVQAIEAFDALIGIKFRQGGFSTTYVAYALWKCMFNDNQKFLFVSKTNRESQDMCKILKLAVDYFADNFRPEIELLSTKIHLQTTKSSIYFVTPEECRGHTCTHLYLDEAAFIPDMDNRWKSMWPCMQKSKITVMSTVNGVGDWFYNKYTEAEEHKNNFKIFECHYKDHPDYQDEEKVKIMRANLGETGWHREIEGNFLAPKEVVLSEKEIILKKIILLAKELVHSS